MSLLERITHGNGTPKGELIRPNLHTYPTHRDREPQASQLTSALCYNEKRKPTHTQSQEIENLYAKQEVRLQACDKSYESIDLVGIYLVDVLGFTFLQLIVVIIFDRIASTSQFPEVIHAQ